MARRWSRKASGRATGRLSWPILPANSSGGVPIFSRAGSISRTSKTRCRKVSVQIGSSATAIKGDPGVASGWTAAAAQTAVAGMIAAVMMTAVAAAAAMTGAAGQTGAGAVMADAITNATFGGMVTPFRVPSYFCSCIL